MSWQLEGDEIDVEAQRRELERLEQARYDRLVAEELQQDLTASANGVGFSTSDTERDGLSSSSFRASEETDAAAQPLPATPPDPGPSHYSTTNTEALSSLPGPPRQCWGHHTSQDQTLQFRVSDITPPHPPNSHHVTDITPLWASFVDSDQRLAEQLQEQEVQEREKLRRMSESVSQRDEQIARALQAQEGGREGDVVDDASLAMQLQQREMELAKDEELAQSLQTGEHTARQDGHSGQELDISCALALQEEERELERLTEQDEELARLLQTSEPVPDTTHDEEIARQIAAQFEATPLNSTETVGPSSGLLARPPNYWTVCPNCAPDSNRRFHLIEISQGEDEWLRITGPLARAGFTPRRLLRVQNLKLYQRLQFEKETMQLDRAVAAAAGDQEDDDSSINERLLYHTSSASVNIICGEGLDQRLSRKGRFGNGVYFR